MTPKGSVSFDRAAEFYDATRALPDETLAAVCDTIAAEVGDGPCLEIGVGTGRIALPAAARGLDAYGIDISRAMLDKLREKSDGPARVRVAAADAIALPFGDDSFAAAYAVHVLHLIENWKDAVRELARVVRPAGHLLFDIGSADPSRAGGWMGPAREIEERFVAEAGIERRHPGINDIRKLDAILTGVGAVARDLQPIFGSRRLALSVIIDLFKHGAFAFTWSVDEKTRHRAADAVRTWAEGRFDDLDTPRDLEVVVAFRAYTLPG